MKNRTFAGMVAGGFVLSLGIFGCSQADHGTKDSPVDPNQDNSPAHIVNFPDTFHNIAWKCVGHDGLYTHTREAAPVVIPNDPNCVAPA